MIPYPVDPSLHPAEPAPPQLGDGFRPPPRQADADALSAAAGDPPAPPVDPALWDKSDF